MTLRLYASAGDRLKVAKACLAAGVRDPADFEGMDLTHVSELEQLTVDEMTETRQNGSKETTEGTSGAQVPGGRADSSPWAALRGIGSPVQFGDMERAAATLPAGRHSAVGLRGGNLVLTLARRKKQAARVYPRTRLLVCSL